MRLVARVPVRVGGREVGGRRAFDAPACEARQLKARGLAYDAPKGAETMRAEAREGAVLSVEVWREARR